MDSDTTTQDPNVDAARRRLVAASSLTERRLDLAGIDTAVLEGGEGPPLVLLHGQGEFAATWLRVLPDLARSHHVIVPDLPGHGASGVGEEPIDADVLIRWLDELLDHTEGASSGRAIIAGHLLGGSIAARYAVVHGERLAHLVLVDTLGLGWFRPKLRFALPMMAFLARPTEASRDRLFHQCFGDRDALAVEAADVWDDLMTCALAGAQDPKLQTAMRTMMPKVGLPPIAPDDLAGITVPTTLIHGRDDLQVSLATATAASCRYGWPLHVIDEVRDDPAIERPAEFMAALDVALGPPGLEPTTSTERMDV